MYYILDLFKIIVSCMYNGIWSRILYNKLYDQKIPRLQGCLIKLHWRSAVLSPWWKECRRAFRSGTVAKQKQNACSLEVIIKRHRLNKSQHTGLWHVQLWLSWMKVLTVELKSVSLWHITEFAQIRTSQTKPAVRCNVCPCLEHCPANLLLSAS